MRKNKCWSQEELDYMDEKWGIISIKGIAKKLGRSVSAVKLKADRIGLNDARLHFDGITINQLAIALKKDHGILTNWIDKYGLPAKQKIFKAKSKVWVISYEAFWQWAEKNKQMLDFSRLERLDIGPEPEWADKKRKTDINKKIYVPRPHNTPWSSDDDERLKGMLNQFKYTYPQIAMKLKRSQGAVKRRILDLGLKQRPVRLPNTKKYTEKETRQLVEMLEQGHCFEAIANKLDRGALGVRRKAERMGYTFKNGVPIFKNKIEKGLQDESIKII